jgi:hypothetical protein
MSLPGGCCRQMLGDSYRVRVPFLLPGSELWATPALGTYELHCRPHLMNDLTCAALAQYAIHC